MQIIRQVFFAHYCTSAVELSNYISLVQLKYSVVKSSICTYNGVTIVVVSGNVFGIANMLTVSCIYEAVGYTTYFRHIAHMRNQGEA